MIDFTNDLHGKHHQVYFDNYFSSIPLMKYLKTNGVDACGTKRSNRKAVSLHCAAELQSKALSTTSGKITRLYMQYLISMVQILELWLEPKKMGPNSHWLVPMQLLITINSLKIRTN